jgi:hypothetical protein
MTRGTRAVAAYAGKRFAGDTVGDGTTERVAAGWCPDCAECPPQPLKIMTATVDVKAIRRMRRMLLLRD